MPEYMKAAEMVYDKNGNPMWDKMWNTYCNLAAEGGPSHRDKTNRINFPNKNFTYSEKVKNEIERGLKLLKADIKDINSDGEIIISLTYPNKAKWFQKIIDIENVAAKQRGKYLVLPWSGDFSIDKEVKSLITVWGKALHYWNTHRSIQHKAFVIIFGYDPLLKNLTEKI